MRQGDLLEVLRRQPFEPFRLSLTNGKTFDIRHPDMAIVTKSTIHVGVPGTSGNGDKAEGVVIVSLLHVVQLNYLSQQSPSSKNGEAN